MRSTNRFADDSCSVDSSLDNTREREDYNFYDREISLAGLRRKKLLPETNLKELNYKAKRADKRTATCDTSFYARLNNLEDRTFHEKALKMSNSKPVKRIADSDDEIDSEVLKKIKRKNQNKKTTGTETKKPPAAKKQADVMLVTDSPVSAEETERESVTPLPSGKERQNTLEGGPLIDRDFNPMSGAFFAAISPFADDDEDEEDEVYKDANIYCGNCENPLKAGMSKDGNKYALCTNGCKFKWTPFEKIAAFHALVGKKCVPQFKFPNPMPRCRGHKQQCQFAWQYNMPDFLTDVFMMCAAEGIGDEEVKRCGHIICVSEPDAVKAAKRSQELFYAIKKKKEEDKKVRKLLKFQANNAEHDLEYKTGAFAWKKKKN